MHPSTAIWVTRILGGKMHGTGISPFPSCIYCSKDETLCSAGETGGRMTNTACRQARAQRETGMSRPQVWGKVWFFSEDPTRSCQNHNNQKAIGSCWMENNQRQETFTDILNEMEMFFQTISFYPVLTWRPQQFRGFAWKWLMVLGCLQMVLNLGCHLHHCEHMLKQRRRKIHSAALTGTSFPWLLTEKWQSVPRSHRDISETVIDCSSS